MIELAKSSLRSQSFKVALTKLADCPSLDSKVAYRLMRTVKALDKEAVTTHNGWIELLKKFVPVNEAGSFVLNEEKTEFAWSEGVDPAEAKKEILAFGESLITLDRDRFELEQLAPACLSASELAALEPLINQPE